jgi:ADP-dependent NAD(P)H-hydrate dehydratase
VDAFELDEGYVRANLPPRRNDSHKGMNGVVCIVGGSKIYHGAPFLCAMGAARSGVDLVYLAVPAQIAAPVRSLSPDIIVVPLADSKLTRGSASRLAAWLPETGAIGIGPGLGPQNPDELKVALAKLSARCKTLVVDADALRSVILEAPSEQLAKMVVTPHSREFERLFGEKLPESLEERVSTVRQAAKRHGVVVLVKGPVDVISDGASVGLNRTHTPAMTIGGTGDVLTGITAGLAAKGMGRFEAACCAAYVNGSAGVEASSEMGLHMVASDLVACIPKAMKRFDALE